MYRQQLAERVKPGVYICKATGKGLLVEKDRTYFCGSVKVKKDSYVYFQYRNGKKVIQKYLGKAWPKHWLSERDNYF